jgi:cytochrome c553
MRNIIVLLLACLFLGGCGSDKEQKSDNSAISPVLESLNQSTQAVISQVGDTTSKAIEKADEIGKDISLQADNISQIISQKADEVKAAAKESVSSAAEVGKEALQKANNTIQEAAKSVNAATDKAVQKTESIIDAAKATTVNTDNGKKVFTKCIVCHGKAANLNALNSSQDISKWSKENIIAALSGYKSGTYGGKMKASMAPIVKPLSESDINDVAGYIQTLGK